MNNSGFYNENKLIEALNDKQFNNLNKNLKQLIKNSFTNYKGTIKCEKQAGQNKSDLKITIDDESHTYSIKKGKANSIHQEPIELFLTFLEKEYIITEAIKDDIRYFIWGDGTLEGNGKTKDRLSVSEFKKKYPEKIKNIQEYFDVFKEELIKRFLIEGATSNSSAEFLYYGTEKKGTCINTQRALQWILDNTASRAVVNIGRLSFQAWNRNLEGKKDSEKRRGDIQLKWSSIENDLGIMEEIYFTKLLNTKDQLNFWDTLKLDYNSHYAIRVTTNKFGKANNRKVRPKADIIIAKGEIPIKYLKSKQYLLDEDDVEKFNLLPVKYTGISVKHQNSTNYTIFKMNPSTFNKLFGSNILASGSSIYCKNEFDFIENKNIIEGWGIDEKEFINYFNNKLDINISSVTQSSGEELKQIKDFSNKEIAIRINGDKILSSFIFFGKDNFEEPFTATWIYKHKEFKQNSIIPFSITTGSGRKSGEYTIIIKPKIES